MECRSEINNCKKKVLPFSYPVITTYTQHAHLLSILSNYDCAYPWILSNYIQLFINKDYKHNWGDFYFPSAYEVRPSDTCQWILNQKINRDTVIQKWGSIIDFAIEAIDSNNYVHTMLNYFYVPNNRRYQKLHLIHDIFVYGYDLGKEVFYVSDFFKDGRYCNDELSFSDFTIAYSAYELKSNTDFLKKMIYLYKFNDEYKNKYKFCFSAVKKSIKEYISCSVPEYWDNYNYEDDEQNMDFGIKYYSTLINYIKNTIESNLFFDIRPFYLLYDHKRIMTLRLKYLYENGYLNGFDYDNISKFSLIEAKVKNVIIIIVKYNLSRNAAMLDRLIITLGEIRDEEMIILSQI